MTDEAHGRLLEGRSHGRVGRVDGCIYDINIALRQRRYPGHIDGGADNDDIRVGVARPCCEGALRGIGYGFWQTAAAHRIGSPVSHTGNPVAARHARGQPAGEPAQIFLAQTIEREVGAQHAPLQ